jgi:hypothetical protein
VLVDFVSPADIGSITVESRILRAGRALTHAEARLVQGGELRAVVMLAYAADRSTGLRWPGAAAPPAVTPEGLTAFPYIDGVTPVFTRQFDYRWATGALPFSGGGTPRIGGWVRLAEPVPVDDAVVLALLDAWPAPVLPLLDAPPTVAETLERRQRREALTAALRTLPERCREVMLLRYLDGCSGKEIAAPGSHKKALPMAGLARESGLQSSLRGCDQRCGGALAEAAAPTEGGASTE